MGDPLQLSRPARQCAKARKVPLEVADFFRPSVLSARSPAVIPVPSSQLPDVPTVAESGFPGFNVITWNGLVAPGGTPKPIIHRLAAEIARATKDPAFVARLASLGADSLGDTPDEFAARIAADLDLWAQAVVAAGIKRQPTQP